MTILMELEDGAKKINVKKRAQCEINESLLCLAANGNTKEIERLIIEENTNINCTNELGQTPLHIAVRHDKYDVARFLLENGARKNIKTKTGFSPLHIAAYWGHYEMAILLLEFKAKLSVKNAAGNTPLFLAIDGNHLLVAKLLQSRENVVKIEDMAVSHSIIKDIPHNLDVKSEYINIDVEVAIPARYYEIRAESNLSISTKQRLTPRTNNVKKALHSILLKFTY